MKNVLLLLFCFISAGLFAQTSTVKGVVKDEASQLMVEGATVTIAGTTFTTTSQKDGTFSIENVPYGSYTIEVKEPKHGNFSLPLEVNGKETMLGFLALRQPDVPEPQTEVEKVEAEEKTIVDNTAVTTEVENDGSVIGGASLPSTLGAARDPFVSTASFIMSDARFRIRGYRAEENTILMNGIPMNDLENGNVPFSAWSGLNEVMRNREYSLGLTANTSSFGGVGGAYALDSRASSQRKGLNLSYSTGNRNFRNRVTATYATGILKGGWAIAASFSKRWAKEGYVEGTFYDGYSYFLSIDKHFGAKHALSLTTFGTPTRNGKAVAAIQEAYDLAGSNYYNPGWGYQNGVKRNAYVTTAFRPTIILTHEWKINDRSNLLTAAGFSFGNRSNSSLDWSSAQDPRPDYYQYLPSYVEDSSQRAVTAEQFRTDVNKRQIDWAKLYDDNRNSHDSISNANGQQGRTVIYNRSRYIVKEQVQAQKRFNFNTTYNNLINDHISISAGLFYQFEQNENYQRVSDLLGGQYFLDVNQYANQQVPDSFNAAQNNLNTPNHLVGVGDKYGYDYLTVEHHGGLWAQPQFHYGKLDFFVAAQILYTSYWRNGLFRNGSFPLSSYGKSAAQNFFDYSFKGGLTYKFDLKNNLYANGAYLTQAPYIGDVFVSPRTRDQVATNVKNEKTYSFEAGYKFKSRYFNARATFYYTQFTDQTRTITFYNDDLRTLVNYTLTGMNTRHFGGEFMAEGRWKGFTATAVASIGRYTYTNRPVATITQDNSSTVLATNDVVYFKNFNVAGSPQLATSFSIGYRSPQFWYATVYFNYYDWMYIDAAPSRRTVEGVAPLEASDPLWQKIVDQQKLKGQFTMNFQAGYSWFMNKQIKGMKKNCYLSINLNVSNIANNRNFVTNGYEQSRFDFSQNNPTKFPPKLVYAYGANYLLTLAFRMN